MHHDSNQHQQIIVIERNHKKKSTLPFRNNEINTTNAHVLEKNIKINQRVYTFIHKLKCRNERDKKTNIFAAK